MPPASRYSYGAVSLRLITAPGPPYNSVARSSFSPWVYIIALIYVSLHLATSTRYVYFRDALYYLACSHHLAFGYVDQPPLIVVIAWIARHTIGTSLPALLLWPALTGASRIVLTAALARELGARRFGSALAAMLAATPGVWWVIDHQFAMNTFEAVFWTGCAYVILRLIKTNNLRLWLVFGLIAGLGLENKYSMTIFACTLLLGVLLTPQRRILFTPWLVAGGSLALLIFLPNLIWNIWHHWPFLELMHNVRVTGKDIVLPPAAYLKQQILMMNPVSFPFWFSGLLLYFVSRDTRPYRALGCAFLRYQSASPFEVPRTERSFIGAALPQYYADEFPWPGMVKNVARVYRSLSPEEQAKTAIFCNNYGEAAAIDFLGPKYGLPKAISGHQSYFLWGPRNYTGETVILVGGKEDEARREFKTVEVAATQHNPYALWYETQPILLCRGLKWNLQTGWARVKNWR